MTELQLPKSHFKYFKEHLTMATTLRILMASVKYQRCQIDLGVDVDRAVTGR